MKQEWESSNNSAAAMALVPTGVDIHSVYHASAIVRKHETAQQTVTMSEIYAFSVGDVAFITAPYEMFSENGQMIKDGSPFKVTFVATCANASHGYIPSYAGYEYYGTLSYGGRKSQYARGTGEDLANSYVTMLEQLRYGTDSIAVSTPQQLHDALQSGKSVYLTNDIAYLAEDILDPADAQAPGIIDVTGCVTLDLNGYAIYYTPAADTDPADDIPAANKFFNLRDAQAHLTVTGNGSIIQRVIFENADNAAMFRVATGTLTIESGTFQRLYNNGIASSSPVRYIIWNTGSESRVYINGGEFYNEETRSACNAAGVSIIDGAFNVDPTGYGVADGYTVTKNDSTGMYHVVYDTSVTSTEHVRVSNAQALHDALEAGRSVTIAKDIRYIAADIVDAAATGEAAGILNIRSAVTLDLNGHTITYTPARDLDKTDKVAAANKFINLATAQADLTVTGSGSVVHEVIYANDDNGATFRTATGKLTVESGSFRRVYRGIHSESTNRYLLWNGGSSATQHLLGGTYGNASTRVISTATGASVTGGIYNTTPVGYGLAEGYNVYSYEDESGNPWYAVGITGGICGDGLSWALDADGILSITGSGAMYDYEPGTAPWYAYREVITSVVIHEGMTAVGRGAFYGCAKLTRIQLPKTVTVVGESAFASCTSLAEIDLPLALEQLGASAFHSCSKLKHIRLPYGITQIGDSTFAGCNALETVVIPDSVVLIKENAFADCAGLNDVIFCGNAEQWAELEADVSNQTALSNVRYHSLTGVLCQYCGVHGCDSNGHSWLKATCTTPSVCTLCGLIAEAELGHRWVAATCEQPKTCLNCGLTEGDTQEHNFVDDICTLCGHFNGLAYTLSSNHVTVTGYTGSRTDLSIPQVLKGLPVTALGPNAFYNNENLTSVVLPDGLTSIGRYAFYGCTGLVDIVLPESLTSVAMSAFHGCSALQTVVYCGAEERWSEVSISTSGNTSLTGAQIRFHSYVDSVCEYCGAECHITTQDPTIMLKELVQVKYKFTLNRDYTEEYLAEKSGILVWKEADIAEGMQYIKGTETYDKVGLEKNGTIYQAIADGVPAKNLGDKMYARGYIINEEGEYEYTELIDYNAVDYAMNALSSTEAKFVKIHGLMAAMLNYGAAAQINFNHKADALMNAGLTEEQKAMVPYSAEQLVGLATETEKFKIAHDIEWTSDDTLVLKDNVWLKYKITLGSGVTANAKEMKLVYWSSDTYARVGELTLGNADGKLDLDKNGTIYQANIEGIAPKNMGMSFYACLYVKDTDGTEHYTDVVIYSIHNYASGIINGSYAENLTNLCKSMVAYSAAAKAYFGG